MRTFTVYFKKMIEFSLCFQAVKILIGLCALSTSAQLISGVIPYPYSPNLLHSGLIAPVNYAANPVSYTIPVVAPAPQLTKFHAQDELGQYNFGHFGGPSSRNEVRDAFGVVRGQVNYIDADGKVQQQNYVADANGYRVAATNLPVAPEAPEAIYLNPPKPVEDTPEVAEARAAHLKVHEEAKASATPAVEEAARKKRDVGSVAIHSPVAPFAFAPAAIAPHAVAPPAYVAPTTYVATGHAFAPAVTYGRTFASGLTYNAAAPAVAGYDATLLRVENNPGHAVSYRVY